MERTKLVYHPFSTHCRSGKMFNLRPSGPWYEPYCLLVCLLICLFVCVYHGSDTTTRTTSGLQILVTLCNDVRNGFSYNFIATSKHSSTQFLNAIYEGHLESSQHDIITPQCIDKMLSNNTFWETRIQRLLGGLIFVEKGLGVHAQRMLKMSRVYTLAEILSKIFVKKRREIGDLIYDHGLIN